MHSSAIRFGERFFAVYAKPGDTIVEIGSHDVNGSLRSVAPPDTRYVGIDFDEGPGVDVLITDPYSFPLDDEAADLVVSSSCFEHSEFFWLTFLECLRLLKPTGLLYLNVPSNGPFHRYPVDCWRFYPDSGIALEKWAKRNGLNAICLESFIGAQGKGQWNDLVAVFAKDGTHIDQHPMRIQDGLNDFTNGRRHGSEEIANFVSRPEDQRDFMHKLKWRFFAE